MAPGRGTSRQTCRASLMAGTPSRSCGTFSVAAPRRVVVGLTGLLPSWLVVWVRDNYLNPAHTRADERMHCGGRIGPSSAEGPRCERDAAWGNHPRNASPRATVRSICAGCRLVRTQRATRGCRVHSGELARQRTHTLGEPPLVDPAQSDRPVGDFLIAPPARLALEPV